MWLKADLHLHTNEGPEDFVRWSPQELIDHARRAGYHVLSFTDHDRITYTPALARYARDRGILLIPGVEATVEGRHVLLYNFACAPEALRTFTAIRRHKGPHTLVVAPHPYYPGPTSLRRRLLEHLDLFDAIEYSHFYSSWLDGNRQALHVAKERGLPLVGCSDTHLPRQFGTTYSVVEAAPDSEGVLGAIRAGRVRVVTRPLPTSALCEIGLALAAGAILQAGRGLAGALGNGLGLTTIRAYATVSNSPQPKAAGFHWPRGHTALIRSDGHHAREGFGLQSHQSSSTGRDRISGGFGSRVHGHPEKDPGGPRDRAPQ